MPIIRQEDICDKIIKFTEKCNLNLKIKLKTYDTQKQYYDLTYKWNITDKLDHPFYNDPEFIDSHSDGEIIFKNEITDTLIKFLMMTNTELEIESGSVHPEDYRIQIMNSLSLFWD